MTVLHVALRVCSAQSFTLTSANGGKDLKLLSKLVSNRNEVDSPSRLQCKRQRVRSLAKFDPGDPGRKYIQELRRNIVTFLRFL